VSGPQFFETKMGRQFYDSTMPRLVQAVERVADGLRDERAMDSIAELLDGQVWTPETLDHIAALVRLSGRTLREPLS
jgi:hypothetical protein